VADTAVLTAPEDAGTRGQLEISPRVVERIAQIAALEARGVIRQAASFGRGLPKAKAQLTGHRVRLQVEVAVEWGYPLADLAAEIRDRVGQAVVALTGLGLDAVSVDISAVELPAVPVQRRVL
jgi:uncharacterized alkaline shock family protein YloU